MDVDSRTSLVSVVVPTRNRVGRLRGAVESVLRQEETELELIVVDDGSSDGTQRYLQELASSDSRVLILRNDRGRGASAARNLGASKAKGALLAFNDDDCVWEAEKLRMQKERMAASGAGVVYCREAVWWPDHGLIVNGSADAERRGAVRSLVTSNYIGTVGPLMRRSLFEEAGGFDERLPRLQEWDLWLRLGFLTSFAYVPRVLVRGTAVPGGISSSSDALSRAADIMLEKWRNDRRMSRRDLALLHYGLGKYLLADEEGSGARRALVAGFRIDPTSLLNWLGLLGCAIPPRLFNLMKRARIKMRRIGMG